MVITKQTGGRARARGDASTLFGWRSTHAEHGRGVFREVRIGVYDHYRCRGCGERFIDPPCSAP